MESGREGWGTGRLGPLEGEAWKKTSAMAPSRNTCYRLRALSEKFQVVPTPACDKKKKEDEVRGRSRSNSTVHGCMGACVYPEGGRVGGNGRTTNSIASSHRGSGGASGTSCARCVFTLLGRRILGTPRGVRCLFISGCDAKLETKSISPINYDELH